MLKAGVEPPLPAFTLMPWAAIICATCCTELPGGAFEIATMLGKLRTVMRFPPFVTSTIAPFGSETE